MILESKRIVSCQKKIARKVHATLGYKKVLQDYHKLIGKPPLPLELVAAGAADDSGVDGAGVCEGVEEGGAPPLEEEDEAPLDVRLGLLDEPDEEEEPEDVDDVALMVLAFTSVMSYVVGTCA